MTTMMMNTVNQTAGKQTNPFWYRDNASYLIGVTNADNNPNLGIQKITFTQGSQAQVNVGILHNGMLRTVIGNISFQIVKSKSGAPFVRTVSSVIDKEQGKYWEHIQLTPQVKAQILRHYEAITNPATPNPQAGAGLDPQALLAQIAQLQQQMAMMMNQGQQQTVAPFPPAGADTQNNIGEEVDLDDIGL